MSLTRQGSGASRRARRLCIAVGVVGAFAADSRGALAQQCPPPHTVSGVDLNPDGDGTLAWSGSGLGFAVIKATQGDYYTDGDFSDNWAALKAAGVVRGAYHFFDATVSGADQANYFLGVIGTLEPGDLVPTLDIECPVSGEDDCLGDGSSGAASASQITQAMNDFLTTVKAATGVTPIVYSYGSWFSDNGVNTSGLQSYPLWLADYNSCYTVPAPWSAATIWQYDDSGSVGGINVDDDYFLGTMSQLAALTVGNASGSGTGTGATSTSASSSSGSGGSGSSSSADDSNRDAGEGVGTACTVAETGQTGECMDTSACSAKGGYTSTPGYCPGPDDVQCCTADGDSDAGAATRGASEGSGSSSAGGGGGGTGAGGGAGTSSAGGGGAGASGAGGFGGGSSGGGGFGGGGGGGGGTLPGAPTGGGGSGVTQAQPSHGGEGANASSGGFGGQASGCAVGRRDPLDGLAAMLMTSLVSVLVRRRRASVSREA